MRTTHADRLASFTAVTKFRPDPMVTMAVGAIVCGLIAGFFLGLLAAYQLAPTVCPMVDCEPVTIESLIRADEAK